MLLLIGNIFVFPSISLSSCGRVNVFGGCLFERKGKEKKIIFFLHNKRQSKLQTVKVFCVGNRKIVSLLLLLLLTKEGGQFKGSKQVESERGREREGKIAMFKLGHLKVIFENTWTNNKAGSTGT